MSDVTERFKVRTSDGTIYDAVVVQDRIDDTSMGDAQKSFIYGLKTLMLEDGRVMNRIDNETFQIVESGEKVTRVK